jgi:hypothetical protein
MHSQRYFLEQMKGETPKHLPFIDTPAVGRLEHYSQSLLENSW